MTHRLILEVLKDDEPRTKDDVQVKVLLEKWLIPIMREYGFIRVMRIGVPAELFVVVNRTELFQDCENIWDLIVDQDVTWVWGTNDKTLVSNEAMYLQLKALKDVIRDADMEREILIKNYVKVLKRASKFKRQYPNLYYNLED